MRRVRVYAGGWAYCRCQGLGSEPLRPLCAGCGSMQVGGLSRSHVVAVVRSALYSWHQPCLNLIVCHLRFFKCLQRPASCTKIAQKSQGGFAPL